MANMPEETGWIDCGKVTDCTDPFLNGSQMMYKPEPIVGLFNFLTRGLFSRPQSVPSKYARTGTPARLRRGRRPFKPKPFIGKIKNIKGTTVVRPRHASSTLAVAQ